MIKETKFYQPSTPEKAEELTIMQARIERVLANTETCEHVLGDFRYTFGQIGLDPERAEGVCTKVLYLLESGKPLLDIEQEALDLFHETILDVNGEQKNLIEVLDEKMKGRASIIASQVEPYLQGEHGRVLDFGAGDGRVTQILKNNLQLDIEGVDVRGYVAPEVTVPISTFDGDHVPVADKTYDTVLLTNVLHHEKNNEKILTELDRIAAKRLVVLETVPVGETEGEMESDKNRTFMNDYLYNRLFHSADVPVPGSFETPKGWVDRFAQHGWRVVHEEDFGFDQPTIKDRHYLLVFEREE